MEDPSQAMHPTLRVEVELPGDDSVLHDESVP